MVEVLVGSDDGLFELAPDGTVVTVSLEGRELHALAPDHSSWWVLAGGTEVWGAGSPRRAGGAEADGTGWQRWAQAPAGTRLTCLLAHSEGLLVGTSGAHLLRADGLGGLVPIGSFDHLASRAEWYTPWSGPPDTRSLTSDGGTLFANIHVGGIVSSPDEGRSWRQTNLDIHADVHQVLAGGNPRRVMAACAEGLAVSDDGGDQWRIDDQGLHATYARALAVAGDTVVLSTSTGPRGEESALYRRPEAADGPFERCRGGLPEWFDGNVDTGCLAATADTVVAATPSGDIWRSDDRGRIWRHLTTIPAVVHGLALRSRPS